MSDIVRILRIVEYVGPRECVEKVVERSIHGTKDVYGDGSLLIKAATIGTFPEILSKAEEKGNV